MVSIKMYLYYYIYSRDFRDVIRKIYEIEEIKRISKNRDLETMKINILLSILFN